MKLLRFLLAAALLAMPALAFAQSNPGVTQGQVWTPAQWNAEWSSKQDVLGYTALNQAGDTMLGKLTTAAPTTTGSGFNLPEGTAPTSPNNGDFWTTSLGLFVQIEGTTYGPLLGAGPATANTVPVGTGAGAYSWEQVPVAALANATTTVNGQACTLGSTCTISASVGNITVGTTGIISGTSGDIEYNNAGVLGEKAPTGTGPVVLGTTPTIATPVINGASTGTGVSTTAAVSTLMQRGTNGNAQANVFVPSFTSTASAGGTTTLTVGSTEYQQLTGTLGQTYVLPAVSTLALGHTIVFVNNSTGTMTIESSGANTVLTLTGGTFGTVFSNASTGTTAAVWDLANYGNINPVTGTAPIAVSAANVVSLTGAAGQVPNGASAAFTATPTLGVAGSSVGSVTFDNATSGGITLQPTTGALGASTLTLPAATDTLMGRNTSDTVANKNISGSSNTLTNIPAGTALSGIVPAANGGAGAVSGALKGNGSGAVSQAACADLSNGTTACSTSIGTSGGTIPLLNGTNTWANPQTFSSAPVVSSLTGPLLGHGASAVTAGSLSGNTTVVGTTSGTLTNGHCVSIDGSGNLVDAGGACTTGGGGGTVSSGTAGQLTYYASTGTIVAGSANETISAGTLTLGQSASVAGQLDLAGSTSGTAIIAAQAAAGTPTLTAGTTSGTIAASAIAPLAINATTGVVSITGAAGQVPNGATAAFTATPSLGVAGSTTGSITMFNGTSGGVTISPPSTGALGTPTFTTPNTTTNDFLLSRSSADTITGKSLSGSANTFTAVPLTAFTNLGTTTTVLHGNAAGSPSFGAVNLGTDVTSTLGTGNGGTGAANLNGLIQAGSTNTISTGYTLAPFSIGTVSSGTTTLSGANGNYQYLTNGGAFTLAAPGTDTAIDLLDTNNGSAGAITFSGFTVGSNTGDALTTTNTSKFLISVIRINGTSTYTIKALQ